jgi:hypothetical protein
LRSVLALGFPGVPAIVGRGELGAYALPAGARFEDDVMAIDQIFAAQDGF